MILTRSPLRITLGGGGTDLPSYYREHGGYLIAAAIDRYVRVALHETFNPEIVLKYTQLERVRTVQEIQHPLIREALLAYGLGASHLEINFMADIPGGTGLGSSGSFTTALVQALSTHYAQTLTPAQLAEAACAIEIDRLQEPVGKQDPYIAAFGGIRRFHFLADDRVETAPLPLTLKTQTQLPEHLLLYFTGITRSASEVLRGQDQKIRALDPRTLERLHQIKASAHASERCLIEGDLRGFAQLLDEHWQRKRQDSTLMSTTQIDAWIDHARQHGALGGKLIGAGGGGFLMFYTEDPKQLRPAMQACGLRELRWGFDLGGGQILVR